MRAPRFGLVYPEKSSPKNWKFFSTEPLGQPKRKFCENRRKHVACKLFISYVFLVHLRGFASPAGLLFHIGATYLNFFFFFFPAWARRLLRCRRRSKSPKNKFECLSLSSKSDVPEAVKNIRKITRTGKTQKEVEQIEKKSRLLDIKSNIFTDEPIEKKSPKSVLDKFFIHKTKISVLIIARKMFSFVKLFIVVRPLVIDSQTIVTPRKFIFVRTLNIFGW